MFLPHDLAQILGAEAVGQGGVGARRLGRLGGQVIGEKVGHIRHLAIARSDCIGKPVRLRCATVTIEPDTAKQIDPEVKAPLHLWVVGILSLLWSGYGCYDFVMTNVRDAGYLAPLPPDMIDYLDAYPAWVVLGWAAGVGFSLIGALLLLGRSLWAAYAFAFSLLGLATTQVYDFATPTPPSMKTAANWGMTGLIWIVAVGLLLYAIRMRTRRVLT